VVGDTGCAVTSTGDAVTGAVVTSFIGESMGSTGDIVGVPVGTAVPGCTGASVGGCTTGAFVGDIVCTTGASDGAVEGTSVGDCNMGARLQTSLPPITSRGATSEHCWAF
jgi:hypothetical protein